MTDNKEIFILECYGGEWEDSYNYVTKASFNRELLIELKSKLEKESFENYNKQQEFYLSERYQEISNDPSDDFYEKMTLEEQELYNNVHSDRVFYRILNIELI